MDPWVFQTMEDNLLVGHEIGLVDCGQHFEIWNNRTEFEENREQNIGRQYT